MNKKINFLAYSTCLIILFLSMGYALFNDSLTFEATGIIASPDLAKFNAIILSNEGPTLNNGDGLYRYNSKYYFSGSSVNNYVFYNEEVWRIVSIEEDGAVKIVKNTILEQDKITEIENEGKFWQNNASDKKIEILRDGKVMYDYKGRRPLDSSLENSYCDATKNGCNAYDKGTISDLIVDAESLIKKYLEEEYFPNMTAKAKGQIQNYTLNVGIVETNKKIDVVLSSEQANITSSFIGLLNVSDYVYATQDTICRNSFDKESCGYDNWLKLENYQYHLLNGKKVSGNAQIWTVTEAGKITSRDANNMFYLRPVVVLNKNITAIGTGAPNDMYILGDIK